jgi:hypothetical protein
MVNTAPGASAASLSLAIGAFAANIARMVLEVGAEQ